MRNNIMPNTNSPSLKQGRGKSSRHCSIVPGVVNITQSWKTRVNNIYWARLNPFNLGGILFIFMMFLTQWAWISMFWKFLENFSNILIIYLNNNWIWKTNYMVFNVAPMDSENSNLIERKLYGYSRGANGSGAKSGFRTTG